jgi:tetratricopeptide (TPR) repeat protein
VAASAGALARPRSARHTRLVRRAAVVALVVAGYLASIGVARADTHDFWRDIITPHAQQVEAIVQRVNNVLQQIDYGVTTFDVVDNRARVLERTYAELRFARKLAPDDLDVLALLGRVADDLGNTHAALDALQAAVALSKDGPSAEVAGRLGSIYLRTGDLDSAIRYLRLAQVAAATPSAAQDVIHLATALALRGQMADAIEVLSSWGNGVAAFQGGEPASNAVAFALAVFYDRDEQRGAAFDVLDRMQSQMPPPTFGQMVQAALATVRFEPAEDEGYFQALLYESQGDYSEARAAWATYAASGGTYRARALEHVAAIDAERKAHPGAHPVPQAQAPQGIVPQRWRRRP